MAKTKEAQSQGETKLPEGKLKLAYFIGAGAVRVVLHQAEKKGEIGPADIVQEATFEVGAFPAKFEDGTDEGKTLAAYGLCKLVQDRTSQVSGCAEKFNAMVAEGKRLSESGQWRNAVERKEGTVRAGSRRVDALVAKALAELKGIDIVAAEATLKKLDKDSYEKITKNEKVVALVEGYKTAAAKQPANETDLADLLG